MTRKFVFYILILSGCFNQRDCFAGTEHPEFEAMFLASVKTESKAIAPAKTLVYTRSTTSYPCFVARIGVMSCDFTKLNQGALVSNMGQFNDKPLFGGLTYEFPWRIKKVAKFNVNLDYNYFLPQDLKYLNLQEISMNGFSAGAGIGMDALPGYRWVDLIFSIGFQGGRFKTNYSNYGHSIPDQISTKNFMCPQIQVYPKFIFSYLVVGMRASYRVDLLDPAWAGSTGASSLGPISASGWTLEAVVGVQLGIYR